MFPRRLQALGRSLGEQVNPHEVTAAQIGALTTGDFQSHVNNKSNPHEVTAAQVGAPTASAFQSHTNKSQTHAVTAAQVGAAPNPHGNNHHTEAFMPQAGGTFSGNVTIGRNATLRKVIQSSGSTVTMVDLEGRVHFAVYNDLAEFFPSVERVEPGDVVVWDEGGVRACDRYSHAGVVGVVSDTFGLYWEESS